MNKYDTDINFYCVSLIENIETIRQTIIITKKLYSFSSFTIICPKKSTFEFKSQFDKYENVYIIDEDSILAMQDFIKIANKIFVETNQDNTNIKQFRLNWYYQQALKISFLISNNKEGNKIVMWDADTIPLKKIKFFEKEQSLLYGSLSEFNVPYFKTLKSIFGELPKQFRSFTIQFFSCTHNEICFLNNQFEKYVPRENFSIGEWISIIILKSTLETNGTLDGSLFSEQELVGISNLIYQPTKKQKKIIYIRFRITGLLNKNQVRLIKILGFSHLTYEMNTIINKKQKWGEFFTVILKEFYTAIRYLIDNPVRKLK